MSNWCNHCTVYEFEGVYDPSYLNLDPDDQDSWKVYADKVRGMMSKVLDIPTCQMNYKDYKATGEIYKQQLNKGKAKKKGSGKLTRRESVEIYHQKYDQNQQNMLNEELEKNYEGKFEPISHNKYRNEEEP
jgi:hypothetical protein